MFDDQETSTELEFQRSETSGKGSATSFTDPPLLISHTEPDSVYFGLTGPLSSFHGQFVTPMPLNIVCFPSGD